MSETLERRRERLAELEARDWVHTGCTRCGAGGVVCAPGQEDGALCGGCRLQEASLATAISRLPAETPPPIVRSGYAASGPQNGSEAVALEPPEFVCELFCVHGEPGPVSDLARLANDHGWSVEVRHSRGRAMGGSGVQLAVADMWTVRFRRASWAGYAARRGDAWDSVCIVGKALPPFLALSVTDLRKWLAEPERCSQAPWLDEIRRRVAAAELHKKEVRCPGAPACVPIGPWTADGVAPARLDHTHRGDGGIVKKVSRKDAVPLA